MRRVIGAVTIGLAAALLAALPSSPAGASAPASTPFEFRATVGASHQMSALTPTSSDTTHEDVSTSVTRTVHIGPNAPFEFAYPLCKPVTDDAFNPYAVNTVSRPMITTVRLKTSPGSSVSGKADFLDVGSYTSSSASGGPAVNGHYRDHYTWSATNPVLATDGITVPTADAYHFQHRLTLWLDSGRTFFTLVESVDAPSGYDATTTSPHGTITCGDGTQYTY